MDKRTVRWQEKARSRHMRGNVVLVLLLLLFLAAAVAYIVISQT